MDPLARGSLARGSLARGSLARGSIRSSGTLLSGVSASDFGSNGSQADGGTLGFLKKREWNQVGFIKIDRSMGSFW